MRKRCSVSVISFTALFLLSYIVPSVKAQANAPITNFTVLNHATRFTSLSNGMAIQLAGAREEITALRDDVLRVRAVCKGEMSEDASWAVLSEARRSSVAVKPEVSASHFGFRTGKLVVEINRKTMLLTIRNAAGEIVQQDARPLIFEGNKFRIAKVMPLDEHYFGLGDKTGPLDRRNEAFTLWNTDSYRFQESTDPIYKSIPFFITYRAGRAAGVLLDNTWRSSFDFGKESAEAYSFGAVDGPLNYYVFYGPSPKQVVESYAWLTGTASLPPVWALGFQQSRYSYTPEARVEEVADRLRKDRIPADAIYLDIDFQEKNRPFTIDRQSFPDFEGMITRLKAENFHVVAITDLHIANFPGHNYLPYDSGVAGDHFIKNLDGSIYTGKVWPGPSVFPDFTRAVTREWWGTLYRDLKKDGVDGFWNDMNEPSVFDSPTKTIPENVIHRIDEPGFAKRTATHAEIHNVYGMENSRATFDGLKTIDPESRPFVLTRATYAGGQRYAATWTGDNSSSWNHLSLSTPMLLNLGLSGFALSGADVGGYAGTPSQDLLTKWLEVAAFQPIDRDHTEKGTADQEPWIGGVEQEAIRRHFIEERYRLMPYLYSLAEEDSRDGLPLIRPLFLEFPDATSDRRPIDIDPGANGEFLLGRDLLIAPSPYPDELGNYIVEFPSKDWYDYWTGAKVVPAESKKVDMLSPTDVSAEVPLSLEVHPELEKLPVFVHAGAILPIAPLVQSTNETPQGPLTLRVYVGDDCAGRIYQDDGKTYAYQQGKYLRMNFSCQKTAEGLALKIGAREGAYLPWWKEIRVEVYGWMPKVNSIAMEGKAVSIHADRFGQGMSFVVADDGNGMEIQMK
jgi:alpha-glucosidase